MRRRKKIAKPRSFATHLLKTKFQTAFSRRITPPFVTLYVTTRCDESCIHCYYWNELNPTSNRDFRLEEFERTLDSMGEIYNLFIGGGEPFLRPDLAEVFLAAAHKNHVTNLYVPTNGQHTERTIATLEKTLSGAPRMRFHLNLSIDHTDEEKHDFIRGKKNAYQRMIRTVEAVQPIRKRYPNLIIHTLTTLMKENQDDIFDIYDELKRIFDPDSLSFNYCRGNPLDPSQTEVDLGVYKKLAHRLEADFPQRLPQHDGPSAYGVGSHILDQHVRDSVARTAVEEKPQFSCVSGRLACVIYSNGDVVECEMKNSSFGNLRDVDYDFQKLWFAEGAQRIAKEAAHGCFCTHECGHYSSAIYQLPVVSNIALKVAVKKLPQKLSLRVLNGAG